MTSTQLLVPTFCSVPDAASLGKLQMRNESLAVRRQKWPEAVGDGEMGKLTAADVNNAR